MLRRILSTIANTIFFNSSRKYLEDFLRAAAVAMPAGARVLDAGAGDCRYKKLFAHTRYIATDFGQVNKRYALAKLDTISNLHHIPMASGGFDFVICTQVLEHIPNPAVVLNELHRVLQTGGELWLSAPLFFEEHETPYDYFRYTQFGLRHLLEAAGFQVLKLEPLEGYYGTLSYQCRAAALALPLTPGAYGGGMLGVALLPAMLGMKITCALLSIALGCLDLRYKYTQTGYCKNYTVVAIKK